jgi:hypothetical protein
MTHQAFAPELWRKVRFMAVNKQNTPNTGNVENKHVGTSTYRPIGGTATLTKPVKKSGSAKVKRTTKTTAKTTRTVKPKAVTKRTTSVRRTTTTTQKFGAFTGTATAPQFLPFFNIKFEKLTNGIKWQLISNTPDAVKSLQNYFQIYSGSMVSLNILQNGIPWYSFNFAFGNCTWKPAANGVWYLCNTTDKDYIKALHMFVDLANYSMKWGSTCCLSIGGNPLCCCYGK